MLTPSNKIDFHGQHFYVGLDVRLKSRKDSIMSEKPNTKNIFTGPRTGTVASLSG
jgi:hypothetical protein